MSQGALALDELGIEAGKELLRVVIEQALGGNMRAAEIVLSRVWPARRGRPLDIVDAPPVRSLADYLPAAAAVTDAVLSGEVTPVEGQSFAKLFEMQCRVIDQSELERRLVAIEAEFEERAQRERRRQEDG